MQNYPTLWTNCHGDAADHSAEEAVPKLRDGDPGKQCMCSESDEPPGHPWPSGSTADLWFECEWQLAPYQGLNSEVPKAAGMEVRSAPHWCTARSFPTELHFGRRLRKLRKLHPHDTLPCVCPFVCSGAVSFPQTVARPFGPRSARSVSWPSIVTELPRRPP